MEHIATLRPNLPKFLISSQDPQFSNIIFKIYELDLLWVPHFIALGLYFIFGTKFSWNKGIDTCFNVECVLLGRIFYFWWLLGGYWSLPSGYCSLPLVTARSHFKYERIKNLSHRLFFLHLIFCPQIFVWKKIIMLNNLMTHFLKRIYTLKYFCQTISWNTA